MYVLGTVCCQHIHRSQSRLWVLSVIFVQSILFTNLPLPPSLHSMDQKKRLQTDSIFLAGKYDSKKRKIFGGKYESKKKIRFLAPTLVIINHPRLPLVREKASLSISPFLALHILLIERKRRREKRWKMFLIFSSLTLWWFGAKSVYLGRQRQQQQHMQGEVRSPRAFRRLQNFLRKLFCFIIMYRVVHPIPFWQSCLWEMMEMVLDVGCCNNGISYCWQVCFS